MESTPTPASGVLHPEVKLFRDTVSPVWDAKFDLLQWWGDQGKSMYPEMYKAAVLILSLAITSARNERSFSVAGHVLNELSCRLTDMLSMLIFIRRNWNFLLHHTTMKHSSVDM